MKIANEKIQLIFYVGIMNDFQKQKLLESCYHSLSVIDVDIFSF